MKFYICYKFGNNPDVIKLRKNLKTISKVIEDAGHDTSITWRDQQNWVINKSCDFGSIIRKSFLQIKKSDVLLIFNDSLDKSEGMLLEIGYGFSLKKKIIFGTVLNSKLRFVESISDVNITFDNLDDFTKKLKSIIVNY